MEVSVYSMNARTGAVPIQMIQDFIEAGYVQSDQPIEGSCIQPASLDLRVGSYAYRIRASFLPKEGEAIVDALERHKQETIPLKEGSVLEKNVTYVVELQESLALPKSVHAYANNKSSTGRMNVWVRTLVDGVSRFDRVPEGYTGPVYCMVTPRSWSVKIKEGTCLNQLRFLVGDGRLTDLELGMLHETKGLVFSANGQRSEAQIDSGLLLTADLQQPIIGYRAVPNSTYVDLTGGKTQSADDYFEPLEASDGELLLREGEFYILSTQEYIRVPDRYAVEMIAYDIHSGEFRSHFAGFFDPGFGYGRDGSVKGTPAVLEVAPHEDVFFRHGQPVCKMAYEPVLKIPSSLYGEELDSHYQHQRGPQLGRHFIIS